MVRTRIYIAAGALCWLATIALWLWPAPAPFESFGVDTVTPDRIKPGDAFVVSRNYRATRRELWTVTRTMVRGDCAKTCEFVDLPAGSLMVEEGSYVDIRRAYVAPVTITPGVWVLRFTVQWDSLFWGVQKKSLPPLSITVEEPS